MHGIRSFTQEGHPSEATSCERVAAHSAGLLALNGCLAPAFGLSGGISEVHDRGSLRKVVRVCVLPVVSVTDFSGNGRVLAMPEFTPASDDSAAMQAWQEINSRHLLRLVSMDSLSEGVRQAGSLDTNTVAGMLSADAFLHSSRKVFLERPVRYSRRRCGQGSGGCPGRSHPDLKGSVRTMILYRNTLVPMCLKAAAFAAAFAAASFPDLNPLY